MEKKGIVKIYSTPNNIRTLEGAKKFCQDMARLCYSEKPIEEIIQEPFNPFLTEKILINNRHHSPFDHFNITYVFEGFPKAFAMTLNNERPNVTSEKSARYTEMSAIDPFQKNLYNKWLEIFQQKIEENYTQDKFSRLYHAKGGEKTPAEKLAQENARYLTSVFTPTQFSHTLSLRQVNILAGFFEDFIGENLNNSGSFKKRLAETYQTFLDSEEINLFRIKDIRAKAGFKLNLFGEPVEEHFGESQYGTNQNMSFACLAQAHRHRTLSYHINDGYQLQAPFGFFIPRIIRGTDLQKEWVKDLMGVSNSDFPQAQLINVAERGNAEHLFMKSRERMCGQAQLEIVEKTGELIDKYAEHIPEYSSWKLPDCDEKYYGKCPKGNCNLGSKLYLERLI